MCKQRKLNLAFRHWLFSLVACSIIRASMPQKHNLSSYFVQPVNLPVFQVEHDHLNKQVNS